MVIFIMCYDIGGVEEGEASSCEAGGTGWAPPRASAVLSVFIGFRLLSGWGRSSLDPTTVYESLGEIGIISNPARKGTWRPPDLRP